MATPRQSLGRRGEQFVADYLRREGYTILARNWRDSRSGEIDIAARHGSGEIVFVEVRARRGPLQEAVDWALESVDARKQARLLRLGQAFLAAHDLHDIAWRVDVAALGYQNGQFLMELIRDAAAW